MKTLLSDATKRTKKKRLTTVHNISSLPLKTFGGSNRIYSCWVVLRLLVSNIYEAIEWKNDSQRPEDKCNHS